MKYFTKEELDYISKELLDNPSKETLKRLSDKYNGEEADTKNLNWVESPVKENEVEVQEQNVAEDASKTFDVPPMNNENTDNFNVPVNQNNAEEEQLVPKFEEEQALKAPVWNSPVNENNTLFNESADTQNNNLNVGPQVTPNYSIPVMPELNIQEIPQNNTTSLEMPKLENSSNMNNQVPFNGNLWENQAPKINNMMQTTDNFNTTIDQPVNNATPMGQAPFFQSTVNPMNNPIPVNEPQMAGPTMFGQFEQNFNGNAAN